MNHAQEIQTCKNCNNDFSESFCNRCGQASAYRITMGHVSHDLMHIFLHADKGIFSFIRRIVIEPGEMAREFIDGKRKIFNPYQYLLISMGVIIFLMIKSGYYEDIEALNKVNLAAAPTKIQQATIDFNIALKKNINLIAYCAIPLFAFLSWLLFKSKGNNYAEHLTLQVFTLAQVNTLNAVSLLAAVFISISAMHTAAITAILNIVCLTIVYKQFYKLKVLSAFGKSLLITLMFYAVEMIVMMVVLIGYMVFSMGHN